MKKNITITVPELSTPGGVSSFWNALLPELRKFEDLAISTIEIGGHGKNIFGPIKDQIKFNNRINKHTNLVVLNPSLGSRSFFRDGLFAKQLVKKKVRFATFFHGWDLSFEETVTKKHIKFFLNTFGKAEAIFVLSKGFETKLLEWGYKGKILVETTTVNVNLISDFFIEEKYEIDKPLSKTKILFLSRLIKEKGIFELIDTFNCLKEKYANIELIIAGDGKDFNEIARYVKNEKNIIITGHVDDNEKIELFKKCDIYCLPSYSEGLPTSVLEAMAFGMPVITTPVGGLKDFFQEKKMGFFVQPHKKEELQQKLEHLLINVDQALAMGKFNYTYAKENLISPVVAKRLDQHFRNCLSTDLNS